MSIRWHFCVAGVLVAGLATQNTIAAASADDFWAWLGSNVAAFIGIWTVITALSSDFDPRLSGEGHSRRRRRMSELHRMIVDAEETLHNAKAQASPAGHPRRFLEFDAFAATVRLIALRDALAAVSRERG